VQEIGKKDIKQMKKDLNKKIIVVAMLILLLGSMILPAVFSIEVDELRERNYIRLYILNDTNGPADERHFMVHNPDRRQMFLTLQLIPFPTDGCYFTQQQCDINQYDILYRIDYNGGYAIGDVTSCWNWWNASTFLEQDNNQTKCPLVTIPFNPENDKFNISFDMTNAGGKGKPSLFTNVWTFSTAYSDRTVRYSPTADASFSNISTLLSFNKNLWRLVYYSLVITMVVAGTIVVVGGIPLAIRWIMSKMRG
jgi:hypothetical protein